MIKRVKFKFKRNFYSSKHDEYFQVQPILVLSPSSHRRKGNSLSSNDIESTLISRVLKSTITPKIKTDLKYSDFEDVEELRNIEEVTSGITSDDGFTHYLQVTNNNTFYRKDEFVYVHNDDDELEVVRIIDLWKNTKGKQFFKAVRFLFPVDVPHLPTKMFFKNEVFKCGLEIEGSVEMIHSRCFVSHEKYFFTRKPIRYFPEDVYLCESLYNENTQVFRKSKSFDISLNTHSQIVHTEFIEFDENEKCVIFKQASPFLIGKVKYINENREKDHKSSSSQKYNNLLISPAKTPIKGQSFQNKDVSKSFLTSTINFQSPRKSNRDNVKVNNLQCFWLDCNVVFDSAEELANHIFLHSDHFKANGPNFPCLWNGCVKFKSSGFESYYNYDDAIKFSKHIFDQHLPKIPRNLRNQILASLKTNNVETPSTTMSGINSIILPYLTQLSQNVEQLTLKISDLQSNMLKLEAKIEEKSSNNQKEKDPFCFRDQFFNQNLNSFLQLNSFKSCYPNENSNFSTTSEFADLSTNSLPHDNVQLLFQRYCFEVLILFL